MSPWPLLNCSDDGARVQAPLTLSDTCTLPVTAYWANQPTSRSPADTGLDIDTVVDVTFAVLNAVPCTNDTDVDAPDAGAPDSILSSMTASTAGKVSQAKGARNRRNRPGRFPAAAVCAIGDTRPPRPCAACRHASFTL